MGWFVRKLVWGDGYVWFFRGLLFGLAGFELGGGELGELFC
jgi:hypothetical protein